MLLLVSIALTMTAKKVKENDDGFLKFSIIVSFNAFLLHRTQSDLFISRDLGRLRKKSRSNRNKSTTSLQSQSKVGQNFATSTDTTIW